jgi:hypothetical protein
MKTFAYYNFNQTKDKRSPEENKQLTERPDPGYEAGSLAGPAIRFIAYMLQEYVALKP